MKSSHSTLSSWLPNFFNDYRKTRSKAQPTASPSPVLNSAKLQDFLNKLRQPIQDSCLSAFDFDPWEVSNVGKDEKRNSSILAWLLNPHGSHAQNSLALTCLVGTINKQMNSNIAVDYGSFCRITTEVNPDGQMSDRLDIEIDAENFYLVIEVKINAPEQANQIERYHEQARQHAGQRDWALIFLTPKGEPPKSAGKHSSSEKIVSLSWGDLAYTIEHAISQKNTTSSATQSPAYQFAQQAIFKFLKQARSF